EGRGGEMYSFWAVYSFRMAFWSVPETRGHGTPCCSAAAQYIAQRIDAGEVMGIENLPSPRGIPRDSGSKTAGDEIATPHFPTSPTDVGWSESKPIRVGKSNATESPDCPCDRR